MLRIFFLVLVCSVLMGAGPRPSFEMLPEGSVYLVNNTDQDIVFSLIDNGRVIPRKLTKGEYTLYRIAAPGHNYVEISIYTGDKSVRYKLLAEHRYILYWNARDARYDVGSVQ